MKRYHIIFGFSILLFVGSLVTTISILQERDYQLRGYADASVDSALPYRVPRLGVNAQLFQYDPEQLDHNFTLMENAHITWVRQFVHWSEIERMQGQFDWMSTDQIFEAFKAHPSLKPVIVLISTPDWARPSNTNPNTPPIDNQDFAQFASAFAVRYGEWVDYYQVWDEPNLTTAWGHGEPRAVEYAALLAESYQAIHAADAESTVLAAALAPTIETGPQNISDLLFLRDLYAVGAKDFMDAVAAKPYGFDRSPMDRTVDPTRLNFSRIVALREIMVQNGDAQKSLWASEWGWNSLPDNWQGSPSIWGSVSGNDQLGFTISALDRAEREWPWLGGILLNQWQPDALIDDPLWGFSLIAPDNNPNPLYDVLQRLHVTNSAQNGLFPAPNPYTQFSGVWTFGSLGADIGWVQDSQFQFNFDGSDVSLLLRQDNYTAYLYPQIDGYPANAVPVDASGNSYIVLTSPSQQPEINLIPVARNLPPQQHSLQVIADRGWDRWALAGFGVSSGSLSRPFEQRIAVGWFTVLLSAISVAITARQPGFKLAQIVLRFVGSYLNATLQLLLSIVSSIALMIGMLLTWGDGSANLFRHEPVPMVLAIISSGLIKLQPGIIVTVVASIVLLIIFYHRIHIGLMLTIFWSPFFLFPVKLYLFAFPLVEVMVILTMLAWLLRVAVEYARNNQAHNSRFTGFSLRSAFSSSTWIDYLVGVWVMLGFVALSWSKYHGEAVTELRTLFLEPILFYVIFRTSRLNRSQILSIVDALVIAGLVVAIIGLWQYANGEAIITAEGGSRRLASVYGSPNNVALILGRTIPFALAFALVKIDQRRRIFYGAALLPMLLALLLTQSVGGLFIGVPISVASVLLLVLRRHSRLVILGILIVLVVGFVASLGSQRFSRMLDFSSGTNFYRVRAWLSAVHIIQDNPITGLGLDQFLYEFRGKYILPDAWQEPNLSHPHNIILDFWVRLGLAGVALLIGFQAAFWRRCLYLYQRLKSNPLGFALVIGTIGSMINLIGHGMIDNSVFVIDLSYVFMLLLALTHLENGRSIDEPLI
ncbi:MAG: O-antigen ligase family protein [Anaerolineae bacterium]|nr:O-antigen ligase family protein [Anaerolineae bacterium]